MPDLRPKNIILARNGVSMVLDENGDQMPELQRPWVVLFIEHLELQGVDPETVVLEMPNGARARPFRVQDLDDGTMRWNWRFD